MEIRDQNTKRNPAGFHPIQTGFRDVSGACLAPYPFEVVQITRQICHSPPLRLPSDYIISVLAHGWFAGTPVRVLTLPLII